MKARTQSYYNHQLSLPQSDDRKTRQDTKYCNTKQGPDTKLQEQWEQHKTKQWFKYNRT